jgi:hypothetical protein
VYLGGSQIVEINPNNDSVRVVYPTIASKPFYTPFGGKVQELANGNLLITEARRGRIFEVSKEGATVWEWVTEKYDGELVPEILEGTRYNLTSGHVSRWGKNDRNPG